MKQGSFKNSQGNFEGDYQGRAYPSIYQDLFETEQQPEIEHMEMET